MKNDKMRTNVKGGTTAVEAGAHSAELIKTMLDKKASGIDLK